MCCVVVIRSVFDRLLTIAAMSKDWFGSNRPTTKQSVLSKFNQKHIILVISFTDCVFLSKKRKISHPESFPYLQTTEYALIFP